MYYGVCTLSDVFFYEDGIIENLWENKKTNDKNG
jgi:hypothetical protein